MRLKSIQAVALLLVIGMAFATAAPAMAKQPSTPNVHLVLLNPGSTGKQLALMAYTNGGASGSGTLVYRDTAQGVVLNGLTLHRLWVPGLESHTAVVEETGSCDGETEVVKVRGETKQRGVGKMRVWVDVRPGGHEGNSMVRLRLRPATDEGCGGHDTDSVPTAEDEHGGWSYNSGWFPVRVAHVGKNTR